jgi:hypothetical protein
MTSHNIEKLREDKLINDLVLALILKPDRLSQAEYLHMGESTLYLKLKQHPEVFKRLAEIPKEAIANLQAGSLEATEVLRGALKEHKNKMEAASQILDRVGITGGKSGVGLKVEGSGMTVEFLSYGTTSNPASVAGDDN